MKSKFHKQSSPTFRGRVDYTGGTVVNNDVFVNFSLGKTAGGQPVESPFVVTCDPQKLNTTDLFPSADNALWEYLPAWLLCEDHAAFVVSNILRTSKQESFDKMKFKSPVGGRDFGATLEPCNPAPFTLGRQFKDGKLGRYTPRNFISPKTKEGMEVYEVVIRSCQVGDSVSRY